MKHLFIAMLTMLSMAFVLHAEDETPPDKSLPRTVILHKTEGTIANRPHAPSNQFITMNYYEEQGICTFDLTEDAQFITVELTETESLWTVTETVPTSEPELYTSLTPGTYTITCTTDNCNTYSGKFIF